jgi:hypothetical protein
MRPYDPYSSGCTTSTSAVRSDVDMGRLRTATRIRSSVDDDAVVDGSVPPNKSCSAVVSARKASICFFHDRDGPLVRAAAAAAIGGAPDDDCPLLLLDAALDRGAVGDSVERPRRATAPDDDRSSALAAALVTLRRWAMTVSATMDWRREEP